MRSDHRSLLHSAGFRDVDEADVTPAYRSTTAAWLREAEAHVDALDRLDPPGDWARRRTRWRAMLSAIDTGLLRRALIVARR